jgi:hypothetical protein
VYFAPLSHRIRPPAWGIAVAVILVAGLVGALIITLTRGSGGSPSSQVCSLYHQWLPTAGYSRGNENTSLPGNTQLLDQAEAEAEQGRDTSQAAYTLDTDLSNLLSDLGTFTDPYSSTILTDEQAASSDCQQLAVGA